MSDGSKPFFLSWRAGADRATGFLPESLTLENLAECRVPLSPSDETSSFRPPPIRDPDVPDVGKWAVLVIDDDPLADIMLAGLQPLIEQRRAANHIWRDGVLRVLRPQGSSLASWESRVMSAAESDPPRYLLIAASPTVFPFDAQFFLDRSFRTGRVDFSGLDGDAGAYRRFADKVIAYESGTVPLERAPLIVSMESDELTRQAHESLIQPLLDQLDLAGTAPRVLRGPQASEQALLDEFTRIDAAPAIVMTYSHGWEAPLDAGHWGALLCHGFDRDLTTQVLSAARVASCEAFAPGAIWFAFACYSGGVPRHSLHRRFTGEGAEPIAETSFVSPLPTALLAHERGPVAFVGHVDRVSAAGFGTTAMGAAEDPYRDFLEWMLNHEGTLGLALDTFRSRYQATAVPVAEKLRQAAKSLTGLVDINNAWKEWVLYHDYRSFILLGDPVLQLPGSMMHSPAHDAGTRQPSPAAASLDAPSNRKY